MPGRRSHVGHAWRVVVISVVTVGSSVLGPASITASTSVTPPRPSAVTAPATPNSVALAIARPAAPIRVGSSGGGFVPNGGVGVRVTPSRVRPPADAKDLLGLRTEFNDVTANPDGTYTSLVSSGRINFKDTSGAWQPIDLSLVADAADGYNLRTKANDVTVRISDSTGADRIAELTAGDRTIRLRVLGTGAGSLDAPTSTVSFAAAPGAGQFSVVPTPEGLEFSVSLAQATDASTYRVLLDTGGLTPSLGSDGLTVFLSDATGTPVGKIGAPTLFDSSGNVAPHDSITTSVVSPAVGTSLADDGSLTPVDGPPPLPSSSPAPATAAPSAMPTASASPSLDASPVSLPALSPAIEPPAPAESPSVPASPEPSASVVAAQSPAPPSASAQPTSAPSAAPPAAAPTPTNVVRQNEVILTYAIDPTWLADPARAFPVTLDPTACIEFNDPPTGCDIPYGAPNSNYGEGYTESNFPSFSPTGTQDQIGYQSTNGHQHAFFYFGHVTLPDGAIVTAADLRFRQLAGVSGGQQFHTTANVSSWSHSTISWNSEPTIDTVWMPAVAAQTPAQCSGPCYIHQDVTPIVRARYTRQPLDWKVDYGFSTRLVNDTGTSGSAAEVIIYSASASSTTARPFLTITYFVAQVGINFDASMGADFVPTTMPAGGTVNVPVTVTNNGSAQTFNAAVSSDYYKVGWRWFDATGKYATGFTASGTVNLPADIPPSGAGSTSATISVPVTSPPNSGQYGLRLDLVHVIGSSSLWASDWAKPSYYYARVKDPLASTGNTRWAGSSVVKRADFPIAVVSGGGTTAGETKSVDLPDGGSLGINTWSRNLTYDGSGEVGFSDLGDDVGLSYGYNSADRLDCTGILAACGWWTNYDEGFVPGTNGADFIYHDEGGNRHFINANANGQLTGAPAKIDRPRYTVMDENFLSGWTGTAPTVVLSPVFSGMHAFQILSPNTAGTQSATIKVSLNQYPLVSFETIATATGAAISFHIANTTTGTSNWLVYTVGTDFAVGTYPRVPLGGSVATWNHTVQRNIQADAVTKGLGGNYDALVVDSISFNGNGQAGKNATYDAIRFEGAKYQVYADMVGPVPAWTAGTAANASANTTDKVEGANSIQVAPVPYGSSPTCNCIVADLTLYPYVRWSWKSFGGTSIGHTFTVKDVRTLVTGSITYYAGASAPTGAPNPIQIAATVPDTWTNVTRNLEEDARSVLGFFNDADTGGNESAPGGGPKPDQLNMTGYVLMSVGAAGLFDDESIVSLPWLGDQHGALAGDDFVVTFRGGSQHRFNRDGKLTLLEDLDNNQTKLDWTYDFAARTYALTAIRAPSDGQPLVSGTAQREIAVTSNATYVRFTEQLGSTTSATGRYTELDRAIGANLTAVIPARRSAACAGSGATGCLKFTYDAGGAHRLIKIYDPRGTGADALSHSISWTGADPMTVTADASASALLRILSWNVGSTWRTRPEYQDADGVAANYARYDDLTPNGSVLAEYVPLPCVNANCGSGTTTPAVPVNMLVAYSTDGIDNYSTEIHYRGTNANPVTSRRGTFAAAKVDNYSDALSAGLTAWKQDPEQYTASMAVSGGANPDLYRTTFAYNALGLQTHAVTPVRNPIGTDNVATQDVATLYDPEGHPLQTADNGFLQNGGFETGLAGWTTTNASASTSGPNTGTASLALAASGSATPATAPELLPGQTFRLQAALKASAGSLLHYSADYQRASDSAWLPVLAPTADGSTVWHTVSYDVTIPLDGNGLVRATFTTNVGESGNVDDVAIFTAFSASAYLSNGLVSTQTDVLAHVTLSGYAAGATYPGIFPTTSTANYKGGQAATPDQNVVSSATYDAWGRPLVATDPDGKSTTTAFAANMTDVSSVADGLGNTTSNTLYDELGNLRTRLDPISRPTTTTYTFLGDPLDVTAPDGVVIHNGYDGVGHLTSITRNYVNGGVGTTGVANVKETRAYDFLGRVTRTVADVGVSDATSDTSYDYVGNVVNTTVYPDGTANPRTTSTFFDEAGTPTGTRGPITPTGPPAPACPGYPSFYCHTVSTADLNGRDTATTDAYGKVATTWYDFAGHPVRQVANDTGGAQTSDTNVTSSARYDPAGHVVSATDPLGRVSSTVYDNLDRVTKVIRPDGSWQRTDYTAAGRTDATSRPGASGQADTDVAWTKNVYDPAGRLTTSLANYDRTGAAQLAMTGFETNTAEGLVTSPGDAFIATGAVSALSTSPHTGSYALSVTTNASATNEGVRLALAGTFQANHTYKATIWTKGAAAGPTLALQLGLPGGTSASGTLPATTSWQQLTTAGWTPSVATTGAEVAFRPNDGVAGAATATIDDIAVWDTTAPADHNIPTVTVYDAASQVIASIAPPAAAGEPGPVTTSTYDLAGRLGSATVNAIAGAGTGAPDTNLTTTYGYDVLGDRIDTTDPVGTITHIDLDRRGNITATSQNYVSGGSTSATQNVKSTFAYDDLGELTASCTAQRVQSDACNPTVPSTSSWRNTYDAAGHATAQIPAVNATATALVTTTSVFDTASGGGRLTRSCDHAAGGSCATALRYTDYGYDNLGRITTTTTFQGAPTGTEKLRSVTAYNAAGERTQVDYTENAAPSPTDSLTFGHDVLGRETTVSRSGSPLTTTAYNPDGSVASRTDHVISATPSSFGYDARGNLTSVASPLFTGSTGFTWRLDGLVAGRTWPGTTNAATFAYDGAKRPTSLAETTSGNAQATFGRTYDRDGWVRSETQTLVGIAGDAGAGTQSFNYDNLGRVTSSSIPGSSNSKAYTYDADSNRLTQTENGVTASFAYDRTDELTTLTIDGITKNEVYDAYGNLTTSVTPDSKKADTQAPTVPTGVSATAISPTQVNLSWTASTDDRAVVRYSIYRGGSLLSVVAGTVTSFSDRSAAKQTAYAYTVSATDAAGNTSAVSSTANVTTPNGSVPTDTTPPTVPTGLSVTAVSNTQLNLTWTASTDANGVQGYRVYRAGSLIATVGSTSYSDTGLTRSTAYSYTVAAIDGTGNASAQGTAAGGTTQDPPTRTSGYTYDLADRLTSINATGIFTLSSFNFDALGRHRTKSIGGSTVETYGYAATSGAVVRIAGVSSNIDSAVDAAGSRLATKTSTSLFGWTLPDLHGDVAGAISSTGSTITDAFRYDAYGETIDKATSSLPTPWRYQGRLLENETGDADLYDFGFRSYVADLGSFSSLDDEAGSAQNPISMNRFLYANANPATLIDPDGHATLYCNTETSDTCHPTQARTGHKMAATIHKQAKAQAYYGWRRALAVHSRARGFDRTVRGGTDSRTRKPDRGNPIVNAIGDRLKGYAELGSCLSIANPGCGLSMIAGAGATLAQSQFDPTFTQRMGQQLATGAQERWNNMHSSDSYTSQYAWAETGLDVAEFAVPLGIGKAKAASQAVRGAIAADRAGSWAGRLRGLVDDLAGASCGLSFARSTPVTTASGAVTIASIRVGDIVQAMNPSTGATGDYQVTAVLAHQDPVIEDLRIGDETIETTPNHPFLTADRGWVVAGELRLGEHVRKLDGSTAPVVGYTMRSGPAPMWDLTVADVHTFGVGVGGYVVHNACPGEPHGNSDLSKRWAGLYDLTENGEHLKYGISQNPLTRYSSGFMMGKDLTVLSEGPRGLMRIIERSMQESTYGRFANEPWAGIFDLR